MSDDNLAVFAAELADHVQTVLINSNSKSGKILFDPDSYISDERMFEVASYVIRDLERLENDQNGKISITKYVAYIGFWFSKLKPIRAVSVISADEDVDKEVIDINENVALVLMDRVFWSIVYQNQDAYPRTWKNCNTDACKFAANGKTIHGGCFRTKNTAYLTGHANRFRKYIVYCLRFRAVSPYFLVNYLEQSIFMSCESACPPITTGNPNPSPA